MEGEKEGKKEVKGEKEKSFCSKPAPRYVFFETRSKTVDINWREKR